MENFQKLQNDYKKKNFFHSVILKRLILVGGVLNIILKINTKNSLCHNLVRSLLFYFFLFWLEWRASFSYTFFYPENTNLNFQIFV